MAHYRNVLLSLGMCVLVLFSALLLGVPLKIVLAAVLGLVTGAALVFLWWEE